MAIVLADESQRLYEQIGTLFEHAERADAASQAEIGLQGDEDGTAVQALADFLATVLQVADVARSIDRSDRSLALYTAIYRYEADRTGGRPAAD